MPANIADAVRRQLDAMPKGTKFTTRMMAEMITPQLEGKTVDAVHKSIMHPIKKLENEGRIEYIGKRMIRPVNVWVIV